MLGLQFLIQVVTDTCSVWKNASSPTSTMSPLYVSLKKKC